MSLLRRARQVPLILARAVFSHLPLTVTAADTSILDNMRAIHFGGNWGANNEFRQFADPAKRQGYIDWLKSMHVNWVGITVAIQVEDSMDSELELKYCCFDGGAGVVPTFTDDDLRRIINTLRDDGFHVHLAVALEFEPQDDPEKYVNRAMLGRPDGLGFGTTVTKENWPWALDHPQHEEFVAEFFENYTKRAVYFATLAEELGVEIFTLGTESDGLFRTRSNNTWPNHFFP